MASFVPVSALKVPVVLPGGLPVKISRKAAVPSALTSVGQAGVAGGVFVAERHGYLLAGNFAVEDGRGLGRIAVRPPADLNPVGDFVPQISDVPIFRCQSPRSDRSSAVYRS